MFEYQNRYLLFETKDYRELKGNEINYYNYVTDSGLSVYTRLCNDFGISNKRDIAFGLFINKNEDIGIRARGFYTRTQNSKTNVVYISFVHLMKCFNDIMQYTIKHEIAHAVNYEIFGDSILVESEHHGKSWQEIMQYLELPTNVSSKYNRFVELSEQISFEKEIFKRMESK
jgi:hypothetical protein